MRPRSEPCIFLWVVWNEAVDVTGETMAVRDAVLGFCFVSGTIIHAYVAAGGRRMRRADGKRSSRDVVVTTPRGSERRSLQLDAGAASRCIVTF